MSQTEVKRLFYRMSMSQIRKVVSLYAQALSLPVGTRMLYLFAEAHGRGLLRKTHPRSCIVRRRVLLWAPYPDPEHHAPRHHLPGASQHPRGRPRRRSTFGSGARVGGRRPGHGGTRTPRMPWNVRVNTQTPYRKAKFVRTVFSAVWPAGGCARPSHGSHLALEKENGERAEGPDRQTPGFRAAVIRSWSVSLHQADQWPWQRRVPPRRYRGHSARGVPRRAGR